MIRFVRAAAILGVFVLVAVPAMPATANQQVAHVTAGVFLGDATITRPGGTTGLFSPVAPGCTGGALAPAPVCEGRSATWAFTIGTGVGGHYAPPAAQGGQGQSATVEVGALGGSVGGGSVSFGTGGYGGYCGYSGGSGGSGTITLTVGTVPVVGGGSGADLEPPAQAPAGRIQNVGVAGAGWIQSAATLIPFHGTVITAGVTGSTPAPGTAAHGTIDGVVSAIPVEGSCLTGSATGFTVVGAAVAIWHDGVGP